MTSSNERAMPLSVIAFDIVGGLGMFSSYPCARILIDGTPLVEMVRAYEMKMLAGDKEAGLAGSYWYLHPKALIEYLEGDEFRDSHCIALLGCTCLDEDCCLMSTDFPWNYHQDFPLVINGNSLVSSSACMTGGLVMHLLPQAESQPQPLSLVLPCQARVAASGHASFYSF